jgi:hypothetical protein
MYFSMKTQNFLVGLLTVGISLSAGRAIALPLSPHAYAQQRSYSSNITGSQVTYSSGTDKLAYNSTLGFITKEMWANLSVSSAYECWIEAGMTKGVVMPTLQTNQSENKVVFQNGHFIGYKSVNQANNRLEYHDAPYGATTGVTGPQIYTIEKIAGSGNWRILVNGTTALTLNSVVCANGSATYPANASGYSTVGIEASDSAAAFTSGNLAVGWTTRNGSGSYQIRDSSVTADTNNLGWTSSFAYNFSTKANSLVFAR